MKSCNYAKLYSHGIRVFDRLDLMCLPQTSPTLCCVCIGKNNVKQKGSVTCFSCREVSGEMERLRIKVAHLVNIWVSWICWESVILVFYVIDFDDPLPFEGFWKWGVYPQSFILTRIFHYKPSILGYPFYGNLYFLWFASMKHEEWWPCLSQCGVNVLRLVCATPRLWRRVWRFSNDSWEGWLDIGLGPQKLQTWPFPDWPKKHDLEAIKHHLSEITWTTADWI